MILGNQKNTPFPHLFPILFVFLCLTTPLQSRIIHIPGDFPSIQGGISGAMDGDTVMVAPGTYHEREIDFLGKAITVMGTDPEDLSVVAATVVDADSLGSVFIFHSGEEWTSGIFGLMITGGYSPIGGGIYCNLSSPTIGNNMILENHASFGGAFYCFSGFPRLVNNRIDSNSAEFKGGGIFAGNSSVMIAANHIGNNSAGLSGAGIFIEASSNVEIMGNVIAGNVSSFNGGGVSFYSSSLRMSENLIQGNEAQFNGGGIIGDGGSHTISSNSITGNSASYGSGIYCGNSDAITNSVFWGNSPDEIHGDPVVTYSNIQGGYPGEGNIDEDPMFVLAAKDDYRLLWDSPCIDTGHPDSLDADGTRSDMGAHYFDQNDYLTLYITPDITEVAPGGRLGVTYTLINRGDQPELFRGLTQVLLPGGNPFNLIGPDQFTLPANTTIQRRFNHNVPPAAPMGQYEYWSRIGLPPSILYDEDLFTFSVVE